MPTTSLTWNPTSNDDSQAIADLCDFVQKHDPEGFWNVAYGENLEALFRKDDGMTYAVIQTMEVGQTVTWSAEDNAFKIA